ncbi:hypothetical protein HID58_045883 [Brassica napus]|uniref:Uncharacterized protein n=1 Tax=Brassica napus TaxID=3708 RepID=A0ABQ8AUV4_BRANA|nr:hypothetical protein HID58_045883 [Brassica napus]
MDGASFYVGGSIIWDGGSLDGFSLARSLCFAAVTVRRYMWCLLDLGGRVSFSRITGVRVIEPTSIFQFRRLGPQDDSTGGDLTVRRRNMHDSWTHRRREVPSIGFLATGVHQSLEFALFSFLFLHCTFLSVSTFT